MAVNFHNLWIFETDTIRASRVFLMPNMCLFQHSSIIKEISYMYHFGGIILLFGERKCGKSKL